MYKKNIANNVALANSYKEVSDVIRAGQEAEKAYSAIRNQEILVEKELKATAKARQQADVEFKALASSAISKDITAKTVAAAKEEGLIASLTQAWKLYYKARNGQTELQVPTGRTTLDVLGNKVPETEKLVAPAISKTSAALGFLKTSVIAAGSALLDLIGKLGMWGLALEAVLSIGSAFLDWVGNTKKQAEATAQAVELLASANENVGRTLDDIKSKPFLQQLSVETIVARTTALTELSSSLTKVFKTAQEQVALMNAPDKFVDWIKGFFGASVEQNLARGFVQTVQNAQKTAARTTESVGLFGDIQKIFGVSIEDTKAMEKIFISLGGTANYQIKTIVERLATLSDAQRKSIAVVEDLKTSWSEGVKSLNSFMISALPQDALSKLAQNQISDSEKLKTALADPINSLATMKALANDVNALKLFPPETALRIAATAKELNELSESASLAEFKINEASADLTKLYKRQEELEKQRLKTQNTRGSAGYSKQIEELKIINDEIKRLSTSKETNIKIIAELETRRDELKKVFEKGLRDQFVEGANILSAKIAAEWAKVNTTFSSTVAGLLGDSLAGVQLRAKIDKQLIDGQAAGIQSQMNLISALDRTADQLELNRVTELRKAAAEKIANQSRGPSADGINSEDMQKYEGLKLREERLAEKLAGKGPKESYSVLIQKFNAGSAAVTERDIQFQQSMEAYRVQLAQLKEQRRGVELTETVNTLKAISTQKVADLEIDKKTTQEALKQFDIQESQGIALTREQLLSKLILEQDIAAVTVRQELEKIETDIQQRRLLLSELTDENQRKALITDILRLELGEKAIVRASFRNKLQENEAKTLLKQEEIDKRIRDLKQETASIIQTGVLANSSSALEVDKIRLDTDKALNKLSEEEYITEKATQELRSEELSKRKAVQSLTEANQAKNKAIDDLLQKTKDAGIRASLEEQKSAINEAYSAEVTSLNNLTAAKKESIRLVAEYEKNKSITEGLTDAITTALFEGGKAGTKKIRDLIISELKKPVNLIVNALVQPLVSGLSSAATSIGSSILSSAGGSILGSLGSSVLGASLSMASIKTMAAQFGSGIASGISSTLGTLSASQAAVLAGTSDIGIGAAAAGAGTSGATAAGSLGSTIGAALPYVGAAVLALNALGVFRSTKTVGSGLMGTLGGEGDIQSYDLRRKSGSLFTGPSYSLGNVRESELSDAIQAAFKTARTATAGLADSLGLSTEAVKNFTTTLGKEIINPDLGVRGLKLEGLTPEQQMQKIQGALADANEEMAQLVLGTDRYNKLNEKYLDALTRLSSSLAYINDVFKDLGFTLKTAGLEGADSASKLVDALGGLNSAQSKLSFIYENFYTDTQKQASLTEKASAVLGKYNLQLPKTREGYVDLLRAASSLSDPELFTTIVNLAPAIDNLIKYSEDAAAAAQDNADLRAELLDAEGKTSKALELRRATELKSLNAVDAAMKRRIFALEDERAAYDKLKSALQDTVNVLGGSAKSLRDAQRSLVSGADSFQSPEQRLATLVSQFNAAIEQARGPVDTAEQRTAVETAAQSAVKLSSDIKSAADVLYASGTENQLLRGMLADKLGEAATILESAKTDTQIQIEQLKTSNVYLEEISKDNKQLLEEYRAANAATVATPGVPLPPTTVAPTAASDSVVTELQNSIAVQKAANDLLQKQLELQAEQLRSNAAAMQAQTEALNRAAEERRLAEEYTARNVPTYMGEIGGGP